MTATVSTRLKDDESLHITVVPLFQSVDWPTDNPILTRGEESNSANAWPTTVMLAEPVDSGMRDEGSGTVVCANGCGYEKMIKA